MTCWRWIFGLVWGVVGLTSAFSACAQAATDATPDAESLWACMALEPTPPVLNEPSDDEFPLDEAPSNGGADGGLPEPCMAVGAEPPAGPSLIPQGWQRRPHDPAAVGPFLDGPLRPPRLRA
jgi:hypothetical protein